MVTKHVAATRAIDHDCPSCGLAAGTYCKCQARIALAMRITREANQELRKARP